MSTLDRTQASCASTDAALWFDPDGREYPKDRARRIRTAKTICAGCSIRTACLTWAIENGDGDAILGGTTPAERAAIHGVKSAQAVRAEQTRARVVDMNRRGVSTNEIARQLGYSPETIMRHLRAAKETGDLDTLPNLRPPTTDERCGTRKGAMAHYRRREVTCAPCRQAAAEYQVEYRAAAGAR